MPTQSLNASLKAKDPFLFATLFDLSRKGHLPDDFKPFDPSVFNALSYNVTMEPFQNHSCMDCGISFYGAKKLLLEHHKIHVRKPKYEKMENEVIKGRYLEYY